MGTICLQSYNSPVGRLVIGDHEGRLCLCDWAASPRHQATLRRVASMLKSSTEPRSTDLTLRAVGELEEYFSGQRRQFDLPTALRGTPFQMDVWRELMRIEFGQTVTYGELASRIGHPRAMRAVGLAVRMNPLSVIVPCHRVVGAGGKLVGYAGGVETKRALLRIENASPTIFGPEKMELRRIEDTEIWRQMMSGKPYNAAHPRLVEELNRTKKRVADYNATTPTDSNALTYKIKRLLGSTGQELKVIQPFYCDYGRNIHVGENFFANFCLTVLDEAAVTIGDNAFIGPNVGIYTACHPTDPKSRNRQIEWAEPVTIGDDVWIGGNVTILPGVTIGSGSTIGAGSVVTRDIPADVVAVGNPARVVKRLVQKKERKKRRSTTR